MTLGEALTDKNYEMISVEDPDIDAGIDKAKKEVGKDPKKYKSGALKGALRAAVMSALDITIDEIIGQAWSTLKELHKYADPKQTPPNEIKVVPLSKHTIESAHEPTVDVIVGVDTVVHKFKFKVSVNMNVDGANVEIQDGKVQAIQLAKLKFGGSIKLHGKPVLEKQIAEIEIPGEMRLAEPIRIPAGNA